MSVTLGSMSAYCRVAVVRGRCTERQKNDNGDRPKRDEQRQTGVASDTHALADVNACCKRRQHSVTGAAASVLTTVLWL